MRVSQGSMRCFVNAPVFSVRRPNFGVLRSRSLCQLILLPTLRRSLRVARHKRFIFAFQELLLLERRCRCWEYLSVTTRLRSTTEWVPTGDLLKCQGSSNSLVNVATLIQGRSSYRLTLRDHHFQIDSKIRGITSGPRETSVVRQADGVLLSAARARATFSRISSAFLVHTNDLGFWLW